MDSRRSTRVGQAPRGRALALGLGAVASLAGCRAEPPWLVERTADAGIDFGFESGDRGDLFRAARSPIMARPVAGPVPIGQRHGVGRGAAGRLRAGR